MWIKMNSSCSQILRRTLRDMEQVCDVEGEWNQKRYEEKMSSAKLLPLCNVMAKTIFRKK